VVTKKKSFTDPESNFGLATAHASHCLPVVILIKVAVDLFFDNVFPRSAAACRPQAVRHSLWPDCEIVNWERSTKWSVTDGVQMNTNGGLKTGQELPWRS
jgi:hypothetical protein